MELSTPLLQLALAFTICFILSIIFVGIFVCGLCGDNKEPKYPPSKQTTPETKTPNTSEPGKSSHAVDAADKVSVSPQDSKRGTSSKGKDPAKKSVIILCDAAKLSLLVKEAKVKEENQAKRNKVANACGGKSSLQKKSVAKKLTSGKKKKKGAKEGECPSDSLESGDTLRGIPWEMQA